MADYCGPGCCEPITHGLDGNCRKYDCTTCIKVRLKELEKQVKYLESCIVLLTEKK